jgi:hypothetical protein
VDAHADERADQNDLDGEAPRVIAPGRELECDASEEEQDRNR